MEKLPILEQMEQIVQAENKSIPDHQKVAKELEPLYKIKKFNLNNIRGIPIKFYVWDQSACGPKLIIEDNGKVVGAKNDCNKCQIVRAKMILENKDIFEWDVIFEKNYNSAWVGVCASENFNYESWPEINPLDGY
ncbi:hypothetical protein C1645_827287 [Glomus cerebriforme]|uniref:Uncharacterized protein n=1 Tax=Glomus cerebriforme TaxID=658196 RepID=A0A397SP33_9GLOM|nr:hypothetical protein C1645_827287 [Glomus cerebriforme]